MSCLIFIDTKSREFDKKVSIEDFLTKRNIHNNRIACYSAYQEHWAAPKSLELESIDYENDVYRAVCPGDYELCIVSPEWTEPALARPPQPDFANYFRAKNEPDVTIIVKGDNYEVIGRIPAHKLILAYSSDAFEAGFSFGKSSMEKSEFVIKERQLEAVRDFVEFFYSNQIDFSKAKSEEWLQSIIALASEYLSESLNSHLRGYMLKEIYGEQPGFYFQALEIARMMSDNGVGSQFYEYMLSIVPYLSLKFTDEYWANYLKAKNIADPSLVSFVKYIPISASTYLPLYRFYRHYELGDRQFNEESESKLEEIINYVADNHQNFQPSDLDGEPTLTDYMIKHKSSFDLHSICKLMGSLAVEDRMRLLTKTSDFAERCYQPRRRRGDEIQ